MRGKRGILNSSGQTMIVASLIITMLLISTVYYVLETEKSTMANQALVDSSFLGTKLSTTNTMISALANSSNGGERQILTTDLARLSSFLANHTFNARLTLSFIPLDLSPYQDGIYTSWGANGHGISSVYVSFQMNCSSPSAIYYSEYVTNLSAAIDVDGTYRMIAESTKQVNVTCKVYNEGEPALASNFTMYYEADGDLGIEEWVNIDVIDTVDYGNGTYSMSFVIDTRNPDDPVLVSTCSQDQRGVFVMANVTCTEA